MPNYQQPAARAHGLLATVLTDRLHLLPDFSDRGETTEACRRNRVLGGSAGGRAPARFPTEVRRRAEP